MDEVVSIEIGTGILSRSRKVNIDNASSAEPEKGLVYFGRALFEVHKPDSGILRSPYHELSQISAACIVP